MSSRTEIFAIDPGTNYKKVILNSWQRRAKTWVWKQINTLGNHALK